MPVAFPASLLPPSPSWPRTSAETAVVSRGRLALRTEPANNKRVTPADLAAAIRARAEVFHVSVAPALADQLARYLELLARWNKTINLTALPIDPPSDVAIDRLIVEP